MNNFEGVRSSERIVLFSDGSDVGRELKADLEALGYKVASVHSFEIAVAVLREDALSVCVWACGGCDTKLLERVQRMRVQGVKWPILVLLARLIPNDRIVLRRAGASDVVDRAYGNAEVAARTGALLAGAERITQRVLCGGLLVMEAHGGWVHFADNEEWVRFHLPPKQFDVLQALAERDGTVVRHAELQQRLWPPPKVVSMKRLYETVDAARAVVHSRTTNLRIHTVRVLGYALEAGDRFESSRVLRRSSRY